MANFLMTWAKFTVPNAQWVQASEPVQFIGHDVS